MDDRLFSTDHEIAVLSTLLKNPDMFYGCDVRFFMLSSLPHQLIFQEIEALSDKQLVADPFTVISSLESSGSLSKAGGKDYIDYIVNQSYNKDNFKEYCLAVLSSYKARVLLDHASKIRPDSVTLGGVDDTIRDLKKTLDSLTEMSSSGGTVHIADGMRKSFEEIVARTANPGIRGKSWGVSDIDIATGGKSPGDWWIISGRPSQGKTAIVCNSILSDGKNGVPVLFFEKEMNYQSLVERLVSIDSGVSLQNIRLGILDKDQVNRIGDSMSRIKQYPIYIDTGFGTDIHQIESTVYKYKSTKGIEVVYIDYLQLLAERDDNQTHELGRISRSCKLMANELGLCMVGLSQLNRGVETRDNKRPMMSDLRQSGNLEEDADYVVGLYRDEYYDKDTKNKNLMEFIVLKARNGPVGTITLKFDPESNRVVSK